MNHPAVTKAAKEIIEKRLGEIQKSADPTRVHRWNGPKHVCGASGYGLGADDHCEGCDSPVCATCGMGYSVGKHPRNDDDTYALRNLVEDYTTLSIERETKYSRLVEAATRIAAWEFDEQLMGASDLKTIVELRSVLAEINDLGIGPRLRS